MKHHPKPTSLQQYESWHLPNLVFPVTKSFMIPAIHLRNRTCFFIFHDYYVLHYNKDKIDHDTVYPRLQISFVIHLAGANGRKDKRKRNPKTTT